MRRNMLFAPVEYGKTNNCNNELGWQRPPISESPRCSDPRNIRGTFYVPNTPCRARPLSAQPC